MNGSDDKEKTVTRKTKSVRPRHPDPDRGRPGDTEREPGRVRVRDPVRVHDPDTDPDTDQAAGEHGAGAVPSTCRLLTVKELAAVLSMHERTCWRLTRMAEDGHGHFPQPLRIGPQTVRWRLSDVEAYIAVLAGESGPKIPSKSCHK